MGPRGGRALPKSEASPKGRGRGRGSTAPERRRLIGLRERSRSADRPQRPRSWRWPSAEQVGLSDSPISDHLCHHHRRRTPSPPLSDDTSGLDHTSGLSDDDSTLSLPQTLPAGQDRVEEPPVEEEEEEEGPHPFQDFIVLETRREQEDRRIRSLQARVHRLDAEVSRAIRVHQLHFRHMEKGRAALLRALAQQQRLRSGVELPAP
jgi:hypothetical protein